MMRIALYQPDIPQNTGTILRMASCLNIGVDIIEPCGFILDDKRLKRSGMDYLDNVDMEKHVSWDAFLKNRTHHRIILFSTKGTRSHIDFNYDSNDILLFGRESAGAPDNVHQRADAVLKIPMRKDRRSLNIAMSAALATGEALRQTNGFNAIYL